MRSLSMINYIDLSYGYLMTQDERDHMHRILYASTIGSMDAMC